MTEVLHRNPASRWRRLAATAIDALLVPSLAFLFVMASGIVEDAEDYQDAWWVLWTLLWAITAYVLLNGYTLVRRGQTLGKKALGIAIVRAGHPASGPHSVPRWWVLFGVRAWFFAFLFLLPVPWLLLLPLLDHLLIFSPRKRCVHDLICRTEVVRLP